MRNLIPLFTLALVILQPKGSTAQVLEDPDPFQPYLFTPEEIMQHRRAIDLNDEQRDAITRLIQDLQGRMVGLQWRLLDDTESVKEALEGHRVDLDRVMDRFGRALETEVSLKELHLELLIRIKNVLTLEQQERLRELREGGSGGVP